MGYALFEARRRPDDDAAAFDTLFHGTGRAVFDFLYPVDQLRGGDFASPWPLTARRCKYDAAHPAVDTLLDHIAVTIASARPGGFDPSVLVRSCGLRATADLASRPCGAPLDRPDGMRRLRAPLRTRMSTRVGLHRPTSSARTHALYNHALLDAGACFEGSIRNVPPEAADLVRRGLSLPMSVGRGRARGWGRLRVLRFEPMPAARPLVERAMELDDALERHLRLLGLPTEVVGRLVPMTLLSPLLVSAPEDDGRAVLARAAGIGELGWPFVARRFGFESGWDQREGRAASLDPRHSTDAGGVFVADLGPGRHWRDVVAELERLEARGAGERTFQGFGRLTCFDPFILKRTF